MLWLSVQMQNSCKINSHVTNFNNGALSTIEKIFTHTQTGEMYRKFKKKIGSGKFYLGLI